MMFDEPPLSPRGARDSRLALTIAIALLLALCLLKACVR